MDAQDIGSRTSRVNIPMLFQRITILALLLACLSPAHSESKGNPNSGRFPNLPVQNQNGETSLFYDDKIKGKIVVISFIFTRCTDICPLTTARMSQVEERLGNRVGRDVFFLSLTVDPENDDPDKLKKFSEAFGAGPGWQFITAKPADMRAINASLGERSKNLYDHRNEVIIGNDATGEWTRNSLFNDIERILLDIEFMDPIVRATPRVVPNNVASETGYPLPDEPGHALFKKLCAGCHTIGVGDRVGPDLRGVTLNRSKEWLVSFMMRPDEMRRAQDPQAMELVKKFPTVRMPKLALSETDAHDLIQFLDGRTRMLESASEKEKNTGHAGHHEHHGHHDSSGGNK